MPFRPLVLALFAALPLTAAAHAVLAQPDAPVMSIEELMHATALDEVFTQFGPTLEVSAELQGVPLPGGMQEAWTAAAREVFDADAMNAELAAMLEGQFTAGEMADYAEFFSAPFGMNVTEIERTVTTLPPEMQLVARDEGLALVGEADPRRFEQIEEMLRLVSADLAVAIVRQSVRGMLIGMSMSGQQGDIEVPWDEIDAHLDAIMPEIEADVATTQRAIMYFAYRELTEGELDTYLAFLRTEAAQKFYALSAYAVGQVVTGHMERFGETLARRMARVAA